MSDGHYEDEEDVVVGLVNGSVVAGSYQVGLVVIGEPPASRCSGTA